MGKKDKKKDRKNHKKKHTESNLYSDESYGRYFNRELSWIKFNERVFEEAKNKKNPLLERVQFLAIVADNLDEYFMVRIPEYQKGATRSSDEYEESVGSKTQISMIYDRLIPLTRKLSYEWAERLKPELEKEGIYFTRFDRCTAAEQKMLRQQMFANYNEGECKLIRSERFDEINHNEYLKGMCLLAKTMTGLVVIPIQHMIEKHGRFVKVTKNKNIFIFRENLIRNNKDILLPGENVMSIVPVRITRDSDLDLKGDDADDLISAIKSAPETLAKKMPSRLETEQWLPFGYTSRLVNALSLMPELVYDTPSPLGLSELKKFPVTRPDLKYPPFTPSLPAGLLPKANIFEKLSEADMMIFTPYDSFSGFTNFLHAAALDPNVTEIQITLYRLGADSPVAEELIFAAKNGKNVTAVIELKASFDEEANFLWAEKLAENKVNVLHGPSDLKVHAKCCLVTRTEDGTDAYYATFSSGNYNAKTAGIYSDIMIFTKNPRISKDLKTLFSSLKGDEKKPKYDEILVSPEFMEEKLLDFIEREKEHQKISGRGHIIIKVNSLTDRKIINALYDASNAGVKIDLIIRGICMLRPNVPKLSENIRVISIVGRFLEHSRVFYFRNGGKDELYIGSPDLMSRNLERRIEIICPVFDERIKESLIKRVLPMYLHDTGNGRVLQANGVYEKPKHAETEKGSHETLIQMRSVWW